MSRKILFASLAIAPLTIGLHYFADLPETTEFILSAIALIPLAWLIGEATEHAAEHTGPGIGGFLNATFGNAPELIIALIAVHEGLTEVVRGSLRVASSRTCCSCWAHRSSREGAGRWIASPASCRSG